MERRDGVDLIFHHSPSTACSIFEEELRKVSLDQSILIQATDVLIHSNLGTVLLGLEQESMFEVAERIVDAMCVGDQITPEDRPLIFRALLLPHRHVNSKFKTRLRRQKALNSLDYYFYRQQLLVGPISPSTTSGRLEGEQRIERALTTAAVLIPQRTAQSRLFENEMSLVKRKLSQVQIPTGHKKTNLPPKDTSEKGLFSGFRSRRPAKTPSGKQNIKDVEVMKFLSKSED